MILKIIVNISLYDINWFVLVVEKQCVFCRVETQFLNII
jgi:hypothetical protein